MYSVSIEPADGLLRIAVNGFWTAEVMRGYRAELAAKVAALAPHGGCRRILVDMSDYPIQTREIAEAHARIVGHGKDVMKARTAIVMTSSLSRLQAKRIANIGGHELFDDEPAARVWLLAAA